MSQSKRLARSEKISRQGISRIFRRSVRELGLQAKAHVAGHEIESVKPESSTKGACKFEPSKGLKSSPKENTYFQQRVKDSSSQGETGGIVLEPEKEKRPDITSENVTDDQYCGTADGQSCIDCVVRSKNVTENQIETEKGIVEDWDKELEIETESRNSLENTHAALGEFFNSKNSENKQNLQLFSAGKDVKLGEENIPLHSTPKKLNPKAFSHPEVNSEFLLNDCDKTLNLDSCQTTSEYGRVTLRNLNNNTKQLRESNFSESTSESESKKEGNICRKENSRKTYNHNSNNESGKSWSQNCPFRRKRYSRNYDILPQFHSEAISNQNGKTEQIAKGQGKFWSSRYPNPQSSSQNYSYPKSVSGLSERKFGRYGACDNSHKYSKMSWELRGYRHDRGESVQKQGQQNLFISTPKLWNIDNQGESTDSEKRDACCRNTNKTPWKMPFSEDWMSEIEDEPYTNENSHDVKSLRVDYELEKGINYVICDNISEGDQLDGDSALDVIKEQVSYEKSNTCESRKEDYSEKVIRNDSVLSLTPQRGKFEELSFTDLETSSVKNKTDENEDLQISSPIAESLYLPPIPVEVYEHEDPEGSVVDSSTVTSNSDSRDYPSTTSEADTFEMKFRDSDSKESNSDSLKESGEMTFHDSQNKESNSDSWKESGEMTFHDSQSKESNSDSWKESGEMTFHDSQSKESNSDSWKESESFSYIKSGEDTVNDTRTFYTDVDNIESNKEMFKYEHSAEYSSEQDDTTAEQFGSWCSGYPYSYEAYLRWWEYEMSYYWQEYFRQMQYAELMSFNDYNGASVYPYKCEEEEMVTHADRECIGTGVMKEAEVKCKIGPKSSTKGKGKWSPVLNNETRQPRKTVVREVEMKDDHLGWDVETKDDHKISEVTHLPAYRNEHMYQLLKSQKPENRSQNNLTRHNSDCISENVPINKKEEKCKATFHVPVDSKMTSKSSHMENSSKTVSEKMYLESVTSDNVKDRNSSIIFPEKLNNDLENKQDIICTCKPSQRQFIVWRICECEAGKPSKLHAILSNFDDRSLDLGYQSYESIEHDESTEGKKIRQQAPGFVIQPLWQSPEKSFTDSIFNNLKGHNLIANQVEEKSVSAIDTHTVKLPPGFEGILKTQEQPTNPEVHNQGFELDNQANMDTHFEGASAASSLRSLIEQQNLHLSHHDPGIEGLKASAQNEHALELPLCVTSGQEHLRKADGALAAVERSQELLMNHLKSAIDMQARESDLEIKKGDKKESHRKDSTVKQNDKRTENSKLRAELLEKQTYEKELCGKGVGEKCHDGTDSDLRKVNKGKVLAKEVNSVSEQFDKSFCVVKDSRDVYFFDQALMLAKSDLSSRENSASSEDENNNVIVFTQSSDSDDEMENIKPSKMVENTAGETEILKNYENKFDRKARNDKFYRTEKNEMLLSERMDRNEVVKSGKYLYSRGEMEVNNPPRMCYRPRLPFSVFPPPYRNHRPLVNAISHMDPRYSLQPPPFQPCRSPANQPFYGAPLSYTPNMSLDNERQFIHQYPKDNPYKGNEKTQTSSGQSQFGMFNQSASREKNLSKQKELNKEDSGEKLKVGSFPKQLTPLKLVDYGLSSDDESSAEIEPFDILLLGKKKEENQAKRSGQLKPASKKLKTDTEDETSSTDSSDMETYPLPKKKSSVKLIRGPVRKLKQKSLRSFSATERHLSHQKTKIDTTEVPKDKKVNKSLSEVIAETKSRKSPFGESIDSETVTGTAYDFPPIGSDKRSQLSPLPPLPPFPNSPFWSMYTPGNHWKSEDQGRRGNSNTDQRRTLQPSSPFRRYSYSPARSSNFNSPSETDSKAASVRSSWRTSFKLFHDFGVKYIDTHCHLDFIFSREGFKGSFRAYMNKHSETFPEMFEGCVAVFCNPDSFTPAGGLWLDVAKEPNVWLAMGCHPKMATEFTSAAELGLRKCLRHPKCIALGEIGLDYSGTFHQHAEVQKEVFRKQLKIAVETAKVLVIHCRDADDDCLEIMKEIVPPKWKIHCHCFTKGYENAKVWIDAFPNLFIGVTPLVTYKSARPTHDLARKLPITKLLLETDSPYFIPSCIPREDLALSNPGLAVTVAKEVAQYQELPVAAVLRQCRLNTNFMYGI